MSGQGDSTPRRALPPRDDATGSGNTGGADGPDVRGGRWSPAGDEGTAAPGRAGTPIPPPAVLPNPEAPPAAAGRRFSAVERPDDADRPLPRRSALSPAATRTRSPRTPDSPEPSAPAAGPRRRRGLLVGGLVLLVVAAVVLAAVLLSNPSRDAGGPGATPAASVDPVATYLLQPADLDAVRPDTTWQAATTATQVDASTPAPRCVLPASELDVKPASTLVRTFSPSAGAPAGILHQVEAYATPEQATTAYAARVAQLGDCERNTAWVHSGASITGLADQATAASVVLQGAQAEYHTLVVSRTGTRVNLVDATTADAALGAISLVPPLRAASTRQCGDNGTCPGEVAVADSVPPPTSTPGFLAGVDLPRITAGAGTWRGIPVTSTVTTTGTRCEALDLAQGPNSTARQQRTLLLQDDAAAPQNFGVDEVVYTFATPEDANGFVASLAGNIAGCPGRSATAQVARSADLSGAGTGAAWVVTQKVDQSDATARFRVAVVAAGNHGIYLMANPSGEFDFADEAWHGVALRAAQRVTQLP